MAETTAFVDFRGEYDDIDLKGKSRAIEKRLSGRLVEAMKILRVRKPVPPVRQNTTTVTPISRADEPNVVISELPSTALSYELPCRDFVQDNRNVSDIHREYQQALFVTRPDVELQRIKRIRGERTPGTCEWLLAKDPFVNWYDGGGSQVLRIIGDADMGKTMLITFLIERLSTTLRVTPGMTLAYHFCDNLNQSSNTALSIVKMILYQVFQQQPQYFHYLQTSYNTHRHTLFKDFTLMWSVLLEIIEAFGDDYLFILVDALDECSANDRDLLLDGLIGIARSSKNVRFLFTSRPVEWAGWAAQSRSAGLGSMTINFGDIAGDVKRLVDEKLPSLRAYHGWDDSVDFKVRSGLNNITGTFPVYGIRFISSAQHGHSSDFVDKLIEHLRIMPPEEVDLKRSMSEHPRREVPWNDAQSTHSLPAYRPKSIADSMPPNQACNNPTSEAGEDRQRELEELRSNLSSAAGLLNQSATGQSSSEPFSIVPTPATSRNPSHNRPSGWQSPISTVEEGDESMGGEQPTRPVSPRPAQHVHSSLAYFETIESRQHHHNTTHQQAATQDRSATAPVMQDTNREMHTAYNVHLRKHADNATPNRPSPTSSDSGSAHSRSEPLFNPAHPVSILIERVRSHAKDVLLFFLLIVALRPLWRDLDWALLTSIVAGFSGVAYIAYVAQQPPTDHQYSGDGSPYISSSGSTSGLSSESSSIFSSFTSSIIRLFGQLPTSVKRRGRDDDKSHSPPPSDPEGGYTHPTDLSPDGLSFWVLACLFIFTTLGGFAVVAQTIACVRVHDESLLPTYVLPTRDDTDHWELLSNSSFVLVNIFLQSFVSVVHIRRSKDTSQWIGLWCCNAVCLATVPCALQLYLDMKYVSKAVTGAGNLIQVVVTFFTILKLEQIAQRKMWLLREEALSGQRKEMEGLRMENLRLRNAAGPMSPPQTPPESDT